MRFDSFGAWRSPAAMCFTSIAAGVILLVLPIDKVGAVPLSAATVTMQDASGRTRIEGVALVGPRHTRKDVWMLADIIVKAPEKREDYLRKALDAYGREFDLSFLPDQAAHDVSLARRSAQINILNILFTMERYAQAEAAARAAWLDNPGDPGIAQYVGLFALMRGKPNEAIPVLIDGYNSLDDFPGKVQFRGPILNYLGNAYELKGDCDAANVLYGMAEEDPDVHISKCKETIQ